MLGHTSPLWKDRQWHCPSSVGTEAVCDHLTVFQDFRYSPKRQKMEPSPSDIDPSLCKGRIILNFFGCRTNPLNRPKWQVKARALKSNTLAKFNSGNRVLHIVFDLPMKRQCLIQLPPHPSAFVALLGPWDGAGLTQSSPPLGTSPSSCPNLS